ncbi:MAG: PEGA domain-containing protein [Myxococcales bacterium]|nr:PEGA domain-containing protein [Myxococcales bacterium]
MRTRLSRLVIVVAIVGIGATAPAQTLNFYLKKAQAYVRARNYERAVEMLKKGLALQPDNIDVYYNIGIVAMKGKLWSDALLAYQGYLAVDPKGADRKKVLADLKMLKQKKLRDRAATLTVVSHVAKTEFYLDHALIGQAPKLSITLFPGTYTLRSKKSDFQTVTRTVTLKAGQNETLTIDPTEITYYGFLEIVTEPAKGVTVYLDKKKVGVTPLAKIKLVAKKKVLVVFEAAGYDKWMRYVVIPKNATHTLKAKLLRPGE